MIKDNKIGRMVEVQVRGKGTRLPLLQEERLRPCWVCLCDSRSLSGNEVARIVQTAAKHTGVMSLKPAETERE